MVPPLLGLLRLSGSYRSSLLWSSHSRRAPAPLLPMVVMCPLHLPPASQVTAAASPLSVARRGGVLCPLQHRSTRRNCDRTRSPARRIWCAARQAGRSCFDPPAAVSSLAGPAGAGAARALCARASSRSCGDEVSLRPGVDKLRGAWTAGFKDGRGAAESLRE